MAIKDIFNDLMIKQKIIVNILIAERRSEKNQNSFIFFGFYPGELN